MASPPPDDAADAVNEFELVPGEYRIGTSKVYSRSEFLPLDDPSARSSGDFIGRLRALFGPVDGNEYVLRHRATGFIVTAYAAQSGPSYGGGPRYDGELPPLDAKASLQALFAQGEARAARVKADPVLSQGPPVDWGAVDAAALSPDELRALRKKERAWMKRFHDVSAPPGLDAVVARLDQLVSAVGPADWETCEYGEDPPAVYREGARNGVAFSEKLPAAEALEWLLAIAERGDGGSGGTSGADGRVVAYWLHLAKKRRQPESELPRVQAAWFRAVAVAKGQPEPLRALVLEQARGQAAALDIDPTQAAAALGGAA